MSRGDRKAEFRLHVFQVDSRNSDNVQLHMKLLLFGEVQKARQWGGVCSRSYLYLALEIPWLRIVSMIGASILLLTLEVARQKSQMIVGNWQ